MSFEIQPDNVEVTNDTNTSTTDVDTNITDTTSIPDADLPPSDEDTRAEDAGTKAEDTEGSGEAPQEGEQEAEQSVEQATYFYGGQEVEIEVPDDISEALKEKGIDVNAVVAELYADGGDFSLSEETKSKLYEAFGKFSVDAFLGGLKSQNEMFFINEANQAKEIEAANTQRFSDVSNECGGDEGWSALESWALGKLSDEELNAFNGVMESGNQYLQMYAVRELESRRKAEQGDAEVSLVDATTTTVSDVSNAPLSAQEYVREIATLGSKFGMDKRAAAEYQSQLDARRRAGMAKGL